MTDHATLNIVGSVCSIVAFGFSGINWILWILKPSQGLTPLSSQDRLLTILFLGLAAAAAHGILWALSERVFHWHFGAGGGTSLPQGWSAVLLSATMTVPLVLLPPLYAWLTHGGFVPRGHLLASCFVVVCAAIAHIILYGAKPIRFIGLKNLIFPLGSPPNRLRALQMESIYAIMHFGSIVLIYRAVVICQAGPLNTTPIFPTLISAAVWFFGVSVFINLKYPESLADRDWIQVRGVIHALMLTVALQGGMLM